MKKLDEQAIEKIFLARMNPETEWPQEAISESSDDWWGRLIELGVDWSDAPTDRVMDIEIEAGQMVLDRMVNYCIPKPEGE